MPKQPDDEFANLPISHTAKWARRNREKTREMQRRYYATPEGRKRILEKNKRYRERLKNTVDNGNKEE